MIALIFQNHYERLRIARTATPDEIKRTFRKMARRYHPDTSQQGHGHHKAFLLIKEAYEILSDTAKRSDYDDLLNASERFKKRHSEPAESPAQNGHFAHAARNAPDDQQRDEHTPPPRSELDTYATLEISLEEALAGSEQRITLDCASHQKPSSHTISTFALRTPPLCPEGKILKLLHKGDHDPASGAYGHLYITIHYARHPRFRLLGHDLYASTEIFPWDAALGSVVDVETPEGKAQLKLPAGAQPWQSFRLKGHGMPKGPEARGDLILSLRFLQLPAQNPKQVALWRQLKASYTC